MVFVSWFKLIMHVACVLPWFVHDPLLFYYICARGLENITIRFEKFRKLIYNLFESSIFGINWVTCMIDKSKFTINLIIQAVSRLGMRKRDSCVACGLPVFLAEKLLIARIPYHRTCFRCARCDNQLTPGNYYETEEGQYCCETCPDEVGSINAVHRDEYTSESSTMSTVKREKDELSGSLRDEEKIERKVSFFRMHFLIS